MQVVFCIQPERKKKNLTPEKTTKKPKPNHTKNMLRRGGIFGVRNSKFLVNNTNKNTTSLSVSAAPTATTAVRTYVSPLDPFWSLFMMGWVSCAFAAWGNQCFALSKYGLYRTHQMQVDGSILPEYNRTAQFIGACFGVCFYWFIVGPMKYRHSDIEKWSKRVGPF